MTKRLGRIAGGIVATFIGVYVLFLLTKEPSPDLSKCHDEGRRYYSEIGSYPTMSTGQSAEDKIEDSCRRNPTMFAGMPY